VARLSVVRLVVKIKGILAASHMTDYKKSAATPKVLVSNGRQHGRFTNTFVPSAGADRRPSGCVA
jgi:hypothetical protein